MLVRFEYPRTMNSMLDDLLATDVRPTRSLFPAVDITEDEHAFQVLAELPGLKKDDVKVAFENGVLTLSGERKPYQIPDDARILMNEMRTRGFERSFEFGFDVQSDKISAEMSNGLLRISIPKAEQAKARTISVK